MSLNFRSVSSLPWPSRSSAMPYLPGGKDQQLKNLRNFLEEIRDSDGIDSATVELTNGTRRTIKQIALNFTATGLVQRVDRNHLKISEGAEAWLETDDPFELLAVFHTHVRYFGELLHQLEGRALPVRELNSIAAEKFDLPWSTPDQVRRRTIWLEALGYIEYRTKTTLALTENGVLVLPYIEQGFPTRTNLYDEPEDYKVPTPPEPIAQLLSNLDASVLHTRQNVVGYIPRASGDIDVVQSLLMLINAASPRTTRVDFRNFTKSAFKVSDSSFAAAMSTLTKLELIEEVALDVYSPTTIGQAWLENPSPENLALILHSKLLFVLEIIPLLIEQDKAPGLARAAKEHYGMNRVDVSGVRTRLQILKSAGFISERANTRYRATSKGEAYAAAFPVEIADDPSQSIEKDMTEVLSEGLAVPTPSSLGDELVESATDASHPERLEMAVSEAFATLGFDTSHIGGGGQTDVLATTTDSQGRTIRVAIDAKAAGSGKVLENAISFDTLKEHKEKHKADFVVVVGPNFDSGRIKKRAIDHGVRLLTANDLAAVLKQHFIFPQSVSDYVDFVSPLSETQKRFSASTSTNARKISLIVNVVAKLAEEALQGDEITGGALTADQIYLMIRDEVDPRPSGHDIEEALNFLTHPVLSSAVKTEHGRSPSTYYLKDSPNLVASKLFAITREISEIETEG